MSVTRENKSNCWEIPHIYNCRILTFMVARLDQIEQLYRQVSQQSSKKSFEHAH